jgi:hypothetical protein
MSEDFFLTDGLLQVPSDCCNAAADARLRASIARANPYMGAIRPAGAKALSNDDGSISNRTIHGDAGIDGIAL